MGSLYKLFITGVCVVACAVAVCFAETIVLVFDSLPPYEYLENGVAKGLNVDIIKSVCKKLGVTPVFREYPWSRAMHMVKNGEADAIFSLYKTKEREEFLLYPTLPLNDETNVIIVPKESTLRAGSLDDMKKWRVGVVQDYSYGEKFDNYAAIFKEASTDNEQLLRKLEGGRLDAVIINKKVFFNLKADEKFKIIYTVNTEALYIAFSKKSKKAQRLVGQFSRHLPR